MRPKIPPHLESEVRSIYSYHGFQSESELVRSAVRQFCSASAHSSFTTPEVEPGGEASPYRAGGE